MKKSKFQLLLSPLFIVFAIFLVCFKNFQYFLIYFITVTLHEAAHYYVSKKLGYKLNKFYVMPYGVCLNYSENAFETNDEIYIALAGPLFNYFLSFMCVGLWWIFPETYYYLDYFCFCNLILATFNMLPCFPLDGGRVIVSFFSKKFEREKVYKATFLLNYTVSFILIFMFILSLLNSVNFTYIFIAIFLFSGTINPSKLSSYNYLALAVNKKKLIKNGGAVKLFTSSSKTPIYKIMAKFSKYKYNVVYVILSNGSVSVMSETKISELATKYSPSFTIEEIMLIKNL